MFRLIFALSMTVLTLPLAGQSTSQVLSDFETEDALHQFEFRSRAAVLSEEHVHHGHRGVRVPADEYISSWRLPRDWSAYDSLDLEVFNPTGAPVAVHFVVCDKPGADKGSTYWNRHNSSAVLRPGDNTLSLPVQGLYRGEAGSRNNDLKFNIDSKQITRLDVGFKGPQGAFLYLDHLRLTRSAPPEGIFAFDFGPESQVLSPGFTAVSWNTIHGDKQPYGRRAQRRPATKWQAGDNTFPTRLYQDYVKASWLEFAVDLENGAWHGAVIYEDAGYWPGEQARFAKRTIRAENETVYEEDRGPAGAVDHLYRLEAIEPMPGASLWDLYMASMYAPRRFTTNVRDGRLDLRFDTDRGGSHRLAALILYPESKRAEGEAFLASMVAAQRREFEAKAVQQPTGTGGGVVTPAAEQAGYALWLPGDLEDVYPTTLPPTKVLPHSVALSAARGEFETFAIAVRPVGRDLGTVEVRSEVWRGPEGAQIDDVQIGVVRYATDRGFNTLVHRIVPHTVRPLDFEPVMLTRDMTRSFWITVRVPELAPAGLYRSTVTLKAAGLEKAISIPVELTVRPFTLDETEFLMGFYGMRAPGVFTGERHRAVQRELFRIMRDHGMNSFAGGPSPNLEGFESGRAKIDTADMDVFMADARAVGFRLPVVGYGGLMVRGAWGESYTLGAAKEQIEQMSGLPYPQALKVVFDALKLRGEAGQWLPVIYSLCDETRVRGLAEKQLELMRAINTAAPWLVTGGSYSVSFKELDDPLLEKAFFRELDASLLNLHDVTVVEKARELGKKLYIYNQGTDRFSFGLYQWSEKTKGVSGRIQWHQFALHGWQFFDLDAREPDTSMVQFHSKGIVPTVHLIRCREGTDDFRYAQTLANRARAARRAGKTAEAETAEQLLARLIEPIGLNERTLPEGLDQHAARRAMADAIERFSTLR